MQCKNVVVVDDDVAILDSLSMMLDFEGYEVKSYVRGSEMLNALACAKPDLILLDMWLAAEDGREICKTLKQKEETRDIPVIIMSASRFVEKEAISSGADSFICKPFEIEEVITKISAFT